MFFPSIEGVIEHLSLKPEWQSLPLGKVLGQGGVACAGSPPLCLESGYGGTQWAEEQACPPSKLTSGIQTEPWPGSVLGTLGEDVPVFLGWLGGPE